MRERDTLSLERAIRICKRVSFGLAAALTGEPRGWAQRLVTWDFSLRSIAERIQAGALHADAAWRETPAGRELDAARTMLTRDEVRNAAEDCKHLIRSKWESWQSQSAEDADRQSFMAWRDSTLNARIWFGMQDVVPKDAAMLLCELNPHDESDPAYISPDETTPADYKLLVAVFEDMARTKPRPRTLVEWAGIARARRLKYHSWFDRYVAAMPGGAAEPTDEPRASDGKKSQRDQERDALMLKRYHELKAFLCKATTKTLMQEFGISDSRVRQILKREKEAEAKTAKSGLGLVSQLAAANKSRR